jgi:hypothetical protein
MSPKLDPAEEHRILESHFKGALDEAWTKTNNAMDLSSKTGKDREMAVWLAMESVEYTSFLFALAHDFEDVDPAPPVTKTKDIPSLVKASVGALELVRTSTSEEKLSDYTHLRDSVHYLRIAFLQVRKRPRTAGQNLTRS